MQPAITSANPSRAPTSGRVTSVTTITNAAATPTITTHRKTAASLIFTSSSFVPRTAVKTKQVVGRREVGEGSALLVRDPIQPTEDREMRRFAAAATKCKRSHKR